MPVQLPTLATRFNRAVQRTIELPLEVFQRVSRSWSGVLPGQKIQTLASSLTAISEWDERDRLLSGRVYLPSTAGGNLRDVLYALGKDCDESRSRITCAWNGFRGIVDAYQNTLAGRFNEELKPVAPDGKELPKNVHDSLDRIWRWSNLDTEKDLIVETAANQGTVGIRVVYAAQPNPRVYLDFDHPSFIAEVEQDRRGNVLYVLLKYLLRSTDEMGMVRAEYEVREELSAESISQVIGGVEVIPDDQRENRLGLCPYVLMRHRQNFGTPFGTHAYAGSELAIHHNNWLRSEMGASVWETIWPTLFLTSPADKPKPYTLNKYTVIYSKTAPGLPQPTADFVSRPLAIADAMELVRDNMECLWQSQPELIWSAIKLLSGISGETLARVQQPVEMAVGRARALYEDAIVRGTQLGMSVGVFHRVPGIDLGTGLGTREAADRAFDDGQGPEAWRFEKRPALPPTPQQTLINAQADQAHEQAKMATAQKAQGVGFDQQSVLEKAGANPQDAKKIMDRRAKQDVIPTEDQ